MNSTGRLLLAPLDPWFAPDAAALLRHLQQIELCAEPLPQWPDAWAAGDDFMRWISFAGCSSFVNLEPESAGDEAFCHLRLLQSSTDQPLFVAGRSTKAPLCPECKTPWGQWPEAMPRWTGNSQTFACPNCASDLDPLKLNWRRQAGFGRLLLDFWNIFPGEARPIDGLFSELEKVTGTRWGHFFVT